MKLKNFCPVRVGDILITSLTSNPATTYLGTTWEELPQNKFWKTGNTPLQQAGSNSIKITKANLPADKLQVESHSMTRGTMNIIGEAYSIWQNKLTSFEGILKFSGAFYGKTKASANFAQNTSGPTYTLGFDASRSWSGSTSSASPYTSAMGSGTPISINPEHITLRAWKRLS